jgi:hypothetical protein
MGAGQGLLIQVALRLVPAGQPGQVGGSPGSPTASERGTTRERLLSHLLHEWGWPKSVSFLSRWFGEE